MVYNYCDANTPASALTLRGRDIPTVEVEMPSQSSRLSLTCVHCGQVFTRPRCYVEQGANKHCSMACRQAAVLPASQIETRVDRAAGAEGCWPWTGRRDKDGYGLLWHGRGRYRAHRVAWEIANGSPVPEGLVVRHLCPGGGNPWCCNPAHLTPGTPKQNDEDTVRAGRKPRGEKNHHSVFTERQVVDIRQRYASGESCGQLAVSFGVTKSAIAHVVKRRSWRHVS